MSPKKTASVKTGSKKLKVRKETIKDLRVKRDVKGGRIGGKSVVCTVPCITSGCP